MRGILKKYILWIDFNRYSRRHRRDDLLTKIHDYKNNLQAIKAAFDYLIGQQLRQVKEKLGQVKIDEHPLLDQKLQLILQMIESLSKAIDRISTHYIPPVFNYSFSDKMAKRNTQKKYLTPIGFREFRDGILAETTQRYSDSEDLEISVNANPRDFSDAVIPNGLSAVILSMFRNAVQQSMKIKGRNDIQEKMKIEIDFKTDGSRFVFTVRDYAGGIDSDADFGRLLSGERLVSDKQGSSGVGLAQASFIANLLRNGSVSGRNHFIDGNKAGAEFTFSFSISWFEDVELAPKQPEHTAEKSV